jgi:hypothetical protein
MRVSRIMEMPTFLSDLLETNVRRYDRLRVRGC